MFFSVKMVQKLIKMQLSSPKFPTKNNQILTMLRRDILSKGLMNISKSPFDSNCVYQDQQFNFANNNLKRANFQVSKRTQKLEWRK